MSLYLCTSSLNYLHYSKKTSTVIFTYRDMHINMDMAININIYFSINIIITYISININMNTNMNMIMHINNNINNNININSNNCTVQWSSIPSYTLLSAQMSGKQCGFHCDANCSGNISVINFPPNYSHSQHYQAVISCIITNLSRSPHPNCVNYALNKDKIHTSCWDIIIYESPWKQSAPRVIHFNSCIFLSSLFLALYPFKLYSSYCFRFGFRF